MRQILLSTFERHSDFKRGLSRAGVNHGVISENPWRAYLPKPSTKCLAAKPANLGGDHGEEEDSDS